MTATTTAPSIVPPEVRPIVTQIDQAAALWADAYVERLRAAGNANLSDAGKDALIRQADTYALTELDAAEAKAHDAWHAAQAKLAPPPSTLDPAAQLLDESRRDRAWRRIAAVLDPVSDVDLPAKLLDEADAVARSNDQAAIAALRDELPHCLRARQVDDADDLISTVNDRLRPHLPSDQRRRLDLLDDARSVHEAAVGSIVTTRRAIETHDTTLVVLRRTGAGPEGAQVFTLQDDGRGDVAVTRRTGNSVEDIDFGSAFPYAIRL